MSRVFPRLGRVIMMAAKEGGPDPESNPKLRAAILNAKAENMPKDNIDAAIKRAAGKDAQTLSETTYEGKGPHGSLFFVECATDNNTRTVANIKSAFKKSGGEALNNGSLDFMFSRKAVFEFAKTDGMDIEALELELIDAGLEEIEEEDGVVLVYGDYTNFGSLNSALEGLGIALTKATLERIANTPIQFTPEQMVDIEKIIEKIEDDDDVQAVYTNIG